MINPHPEASVTVIPPIHRMDPPLKSVQRLRGRVLEQLTSLRDELANLTSETTKKKIHDMRVLSRRLRAAFTLLKPLVENPKITGLFKRIRMLTEALGPVRSLDVALNDLRERFTDLEGHRPSLPLLIEWVRKRRKKLRKRLPQEISEVQILKTLRKFKPQEIPHLPSEDLQTMLEKKLTKALRNLEKNWNLFHKKQKIADLHHLRVDLKKWRYLFEIKSEIMGIPGAADFLEKVKNLQDRLGGIHDLEVLQETVSSPKFRRIAQENKVQKDLRGFVKDLRNQMDQELQLFLKEGEKAIMEIIAFTQGVYSLALAEPDAC